MKKINVTFSRFEGQGTQSPVFKDTEGNEYFWPVSDNLSFEVNARHFWDELGYNKRLRYKITSKENGSVKYISGIYGIK